MERSILLLHLFQGLSKITLTHSFTHGLTYHALANFKNLSVGLFHCVFARYFDWLLVWFEARLMIQLPFTYQSEFGKFNTKMVIPTNYSTQILASP